MMHFLWWAYIIIQGISACLARISIDYLLSIMCTTSWNDALGQIVNMSGVVGDLIEMRSPGSWSTESLARRDKPEPFFHWVMLWSLTNILSKIISFTEILQKGGLSFITWHNSIKTRIYSTSSSINGDADISTLFPVFSYLSTHIHASSSSLIVDHSIFISMCIEQGPPWN